MDGDVFFGMRQGFAVGFKVISPLENAVLLFHVRHPFKADAPEVQAVRYATAISNLREAKELEIEFEDRLTWITFINGIDPLFDGSLPQLVDSILDSFTVAGLARGAGLCHYCHREQVKEPLCVHGKVALICPACLSERASAPENLPAEASEGALSVGMLAPLAAVVGAIGWAGFWIGFLLIIESFHTETVFIPHIVEAIILVCAAFLTGGPVGFVIKRVRRRGSHLSVAFSGVCAIAAVVLGEVTFIAWLVYREIKVFSPGTAWTILPQVEMEFGAFHLAVKCLAALLAVFIAVSMAKPEKVRIKL